MKKVLTSKSFLTVMSILSILLCFAILCGAVMLFLQHLGWVSFSQDEQEVTVAAGEENDDEQFPLYDKQPSAVSGEGIDGIVPEELICEMPFIDQYYMKLTLLSDLNEGAFKQGIYEIWRSGDRYRIHRYDLVSQEVEFIMICDGNRVQTQDFSSATVTYAPYDAAYAFAVVAPIPNFKKLFADIHVFSSYLEGKADCSFSCEYPALGVVDHVEFSKSTGLISRYRRIYGETPLLSISVTEAYQGTFMDYIFYFD